MNFSSSESITARRAQEPNRRHFLGGSDARIIMSPDEAALIRLWREKRGEAEPADLGGDLIVQLGVATETLNRSWYERNTGRSITDVQRWVQHPVHRYLAATLDGFVNGLDAVFEAKFMLALVVFRRGRDRKAHGPAPAQYVGDQRPIRGAIHHHWRGQMD